MSDQTPQERVIAAREEIADAKATAAAEEHATSDERVAADGFPILLTDGSEVMAVAKVDEAHGAHSVVDADGQRYTRVRSTGRYEAASDEAPAADEAPAEPEGEE